MSIFSSYKKIFLLGFIVVILIAIPLSVYVAQQNQDTRSKADASTTLSLQPSSATVNVGEDVVLSIMLDPKTGTPGSLPNQISFVKLSIKFDPAQFTTVSDSLTPNPNSPNTLTSILEEAVYDNTIGTASISLSVGADPTKVITTKTTIATLKLKALAEAKPTSPNITFDSAPNTQVLSIAGSDGTSENVLSSAEPATVTISSSSTSPNPTPTSAPVNPNATPTAIPPTSAPSAPTPTIVTEVTESGTTIVVEPTPTPQALPTQTVLPQTGPEDNILGIGIMGAIITVIGGALFILL